jgi:hypothetical protein
LQSRAQLVQDFEPDLSDRIGDHDRPLVTNSRQHRHAACRFACAGRGRNADPRGVSSCTRPECGVLNAAAGCAGNQPQRRQRARPQGGIGLKLDSCFDFRALSAGIRALSRIMSTTRHKMIKALKSPHGLRRSSVTESAHAPALITGASHARVPISDVSAARCGAASLPSMPSHHNSAARHPVSPRIRALDTAMHQVRPDPRGPGRRRSHEVRRRRLDGQQPQSADMRSAYG